MMEDMRVENMGGINLSQGAEFAGMTSEWRDLWKRLWPRRSRRALTLTVSKPHQTLAISVTGSRCELRCAHCDGHYLEAMADLRHLDETKLANSTSLLISGGSDRQGAVPLRDHQERILELSDRYNLNLHIGYQEASNLDFLEGRRVTISLDLIGDAATIKRVFGLDHPPEAYYELYRKLTRKFRVVPHLTVGLSGGEPSGEEHVIEYLAHDPPPAMTFIVFRPTHGTAFERCVAPPIERVVELIDLSCDRLPCDLHLGCMRPGGGYRTRLDPLAWLAGARTIVMPDRRFVDTLLHNGIRIHETSQCCSLDPGVVP